MTFYRLSALYFPSKTHIINYAKWTLQILCKSSAKNYWLNNDEGGTFHVFGKKNNKTTKCGYRRAESQACWGVWSLTSALMPFVTSETNHAQSWEPDNCEWVYRKDRDTYCCGLSLLSTKLLSTYNSHVLPLNLCGFLPGALNTSHSPATCRPGRLRLATAIWQQCFFYGIVYF